MRRPPPRSPLFPYTTLFRSVAGALADPVHRAFHLPRPGRNGGERVGDGETQVVVTVRREGDALGPGDALPHRDRKSTRLNSSHVSISYAVFCLKKKKSQYRR